MQDLIINKEFESLIPSLTADEFKTLELSIIKDGLREPIITNKGVIIDGHNRYKICAEHNIPFKTAEKDFESENDIKIWIIKNQFGRRNLQNIDRIQLALILEPLISEKAKAQQGTRTDLKADNICQISDKSIKEQVKPLKPIDTKKELAKIAGVSHDTISKVKKIADISPDAIDRIKAGKTTINKAYKDIKKAELRSHFAEQGKDIEIKDGDIELRQGNFLTALNDIPDNSVQSIITDPPYAKESIAIYADLAEFAFKKLKPSGFLVAYAGQAHLPEILNFLMNKGLNYFWTYCLYHSGAKAAVDYVNIVNAWKPILIFQKPPLKRRGRGYDYIISEQAEKDGHDWQQSESGVSFLIDHFSDPGELILEPFTGSGTTLIAAKKLNRKCIGAELNPETFNIAKARIANATGGQI